MTTISEDEREVYHLAHDLSTTVTVDYHLVENLGVPPYVVAMHRGCSIKNIHMNLNTAKETLGDDYATESVEYAKNDAPSSEILRLVGHELTPTEIVTYHLVENLGASLDMVQLHRDLESVQTVEKAYNNARAKLGEFTDE